MSVQNNIAGGESMVLERPAAGGVYASLFEKINLSPVSELSALDIWQDAQAMSDATADERLTAGMQVFLECLTKAGAKVEKLDKSLIDHHIAELDYQISRQLDAVMHHEEFQAVEGLWRGVKSLIDKTDFRQNVKIELLSMSKEDLRQDFEDSPEIIQSGLYKHTYIDEYDTPGGEPIAALISAYEFDASAQDVALLRNISKVSAAAHMPFIGSAGPKFFLKESMEDVAAIKDIGNYFDRAEYIKWKSFRDTDDARYIGLVMPRVLGRLPYGPDTVPVRSFNYVEEVKGPDHDKYLWTNASFAFASNMVRSFINNGWCVQIRGPQAGGAVQDLPIHLYDLGTGNQVKIPSEVMIPETREFEFANLGFIPLSYYKNRDYACFFSANSSQKPALYDTADATANSRINARLPYIFLLSRTRVKVSPYCLRPVEIGKPLGFYGDDDFLLDGNTPLGDEAMDAGSQLLVALKTDNEQEAQGWKPDGLLYQDFLVMLRVYLGWRFKARITLTTPVRLLAAPPLGENPFWLGMNGVLGAEADSLPDDIPETFTTELGYYRGLEPAKPQQGNRRVTYKFN